MKIKMRMVLAGLLALLSLAPAGRAAAAVAGPADASRNAAAVATSDFRDANLDRVHRFLAEASAGGEALADYYFVLVGDIQNGPRNFNHDVFNAIAKEVESAVDPKTGDHLYDRIRFVILLGDLVDEGTGSKQWDALARAFAGRDPDGKPYPFLSLLIKDKPIFPALGNHEILSFRPFPQDRYKDLFDSPRGVVNFKKFFGWDRWIADPHILYPVPADLAADTFRDVLARLTDPADRRSLTASYGLKADGRYHLKFYDRPSLHEAEFQAGRARLAAELAPVFRRAGYGTLPVLNSDSMICYAFEAGKVMYVILDSMSRGWHYPVFAGFKQALYPAKRDQHRLNLYTLSPYNGQADFYEAVAAYAHERGDTVVPMMHHSFFNTARNPYSLGIEYNSWLGLGLPQGPQEKGDPTLMDKIIFSDVPVFFSACVHRYESFTIVAKTPGQPDHALHWTISGGGGGPFKAGPITYTTIKVREGLYNKKLENESGPTAGRSIEMKDATARFGFHYLLVHVRDGQVVEASPHFLEPADLPRSLSRPQIALTALYASGPGSTGASVEFSPGFWGAEKFIRYLAFVYWRPSVSLGFVDYNVWGKGLDARAVAVTMEVSPLTLECHIQRGNIVTLRPLNFEYWDGRGSLRRAFLTTGLEAPLIYDLTGRLEKLNFGLKVLFPLRAGAAADPSFGAKTGVAFSVGYRFKL
jgi:hypothetical protein